MVDIVTRARRSKPSQSEVIAWLSMFGIAVYRDIAGCWCACKPTDSPLITTRIAGPNDNFVSMARSAFRYAARAAESPHA